MYEHNDVWGTTSCDASQGVCTVAAVPTCLFTIEDLSLKTQPKIDAVVRTGPMTCQGRAGCLVRNVSKPLRLIRDRIDLDGEGELHRASNSSPQYRPLPQLAVATAIERQVVRGLCMATRLL